MGLLSGGGEVQRIATCGLSFPSVPVLPFLSTAERRLCAMLLRDYCL